MDFHNEYFNLGVLDTLSYGNTRIHHLDPRTKVVSTLAFIITVVSFPKYEVTGLIPFFVVPVVILSLGDIPCRFILKKVLFTSIFVALIGLFNPLLDTQTMYHFLRVPISGGWVSFLSIMLRFFLTMSAVLLLISTTSFPGVAHALRKLGVPEVFVSQLLFLYRYLFVLMEETMRMVMARDLRSFDGRGQGVRIFVTLLGTLFIRTIERAERIYGAMLCRGFTGTIHPSRQHTFGKADFVYLFVTALVLFLFRTSDLVGLIGRQAERIL